MVVLHSFFTKPVQNESCSWDKLSHSDVMRAACGVDENDAVRVARFNDSFREEVRLML